MVQNVRLKKWVPLSLMTLVVISVMVLLYRPSFEGGLYLDSKAYIGKGYFFQYGIKFSEAVSRVFVQGYHPAGRRILPNLTVAIQTYNSPNPIGELRSVNAIIHGLNTVILFIITSIFIRYLYPSWDKRASTVAASLSSALWAFNPFLAFTVPYVVQRSVLLEAGFFLLAIYFFMNIVSQTTHGGKAKLWSAMTISVTMAALSKENAILFPVTAGLIYLYFPETHRPGSGKVKGRVLLGLSLLVPVILFSTFLIRALEKNPTAGFSARPFTLTERLMTEARVVLDQLALFIFPFPNRLSLTPYYSISRGLLSPATTLASLIAIALLLILVWRARHRAPIFGVAFIWYFSGHLLESTILPLDISFLHRNYLPTALIFAAIVTTALDMASSKGRRTTLAIPGLISAVICLFAALTFNTAHLWGNEVQFWTKSMENYPKAVFPYIALSGYYLEKNLPNRALEITGMGLERSDLKSVRNYKKASLFANRGLALADTGRIQDGIEWIEKAEKINPKELSFKYNLGVLLMRAYRNQEAGELFRYIIKSDPTYPDAHLQLALIYESTGRDDIALELITREVSLFPSNNYAKSILFRLQKKLRK
jgi:tetratricopeptide (TPR) repeat protein